MSFTRKAFASQDQSDRSPSAIGVFIAGLPKHSGAARTSTYRESPEFAAAEQAAAAQKRAPHATVPAPPAAALGNVTLVKEKYAIALKAKSAYEDAKENAEKARTAYIAAVKALAVVLEAELKGIPHGGKKQWLEQHCGFKYPTVYRWIKAAHVEFSTGNEAGREMTSLRSVNPSGRRKVSREEMKAAEPAEVIEKTSCDSGLCKQVEASDRLGDGLDAARAAVLEDAEQEHHRIGGLDPTKHARWNAAPAEIQQCALQLVKANRLRRIEMVQLLATLVAIDFEDVTELSAKMRAA